MGWLAPRSFDWAFAVNRKPRHRKQKLKLFTGKSMVHQCFGFGGTGAWAQALTPQIGVGTRAQAMVAPIPQNGWSVYFGSVLCTFRLKVR